MMSVFKWFAVLNECFTIQDNGLNMVKALTYCMPQKRNKNSLVGV